MQFAPLGDTGLIVSRLSFGAMTFGSGSEMAGGLRYRLDQVSADRIIGRCLDAGRTSTRVRARSWKNSHPDWNPDSSARR